MPVIVIDKFSGKEKPLFNGQEKFEYHLNRAKKDSSASAVERAYSRGWLNQRKSQTAQFKKDHPNYSPKHQKKNK